MGASGVGERLMAIQAAQLHVLAVEKKTLPVKRASRNPIRVL